MITRSAYRLNRRGMMARPHVASAVALWMTLGVVVPWLLGVPLTATQVAVGALLAAFAGLLPDIDTPKSTIAHIADPVSRWVARGVARVCNPGGEHRCEVRSECRCGHRRATHTILFVAAAAALAAWFGSQTRTTVAGLPNLALLVLTVPAALVVVKATVPRTIKMLIGAPGRAALVVSIAGIAAAIALPGWWIGWPILVGGLAHLAGDAVTGKGVPALAPLTFKRLQPFDLGIGSGAERAVMWLFVFVAVAMVPFATSRAEPPPGPHQSPGVSLSEFGELSRQ